MLVKVCCVLVLIKVEFVVQVELLGLGYVIGCVELMLLFDEDVVVVLLFDDLVLLIGVLEMMLKV